MPLEFGIFDHVDRSDRPLPDFYEDRLKLIEAYDRVGIRTYHCAEHHFTPLGMATSPSVFLSAVAQRTKNLRFGPLVYTLALYHPLRLAEEICMLDQMSRGRLDLGVGKGISPIETAYYGIDYTRADAIFGEAMNVIRQSLTQDNVNFEGAFYNFRDVPVQLKPHQKPMPPLWYGIISPDSAARAAKARMNVIANVASSRFRAMADSYRENFTPERPGDPMPRIGINRYLVIGETDAEALAVARRAYRVWHANFMHLWNKHGRNPVGVVYPPEIDEQMADGRAIVGSPDTVLRLLRKEMADSGANYLVVRFAFGDLALDESLHSLDLFARHVMPAMREEKLQAAE
jgi:alkanesulfonate monooxygenase SsuD/methylene tetrahydromethanopterin reductase-like flavin-dependent oxidoreductase (luciferase family)